MISKEDNLFSLSCSLLDCGTLDLKFLVDLVDKIDNQKFKIKGEETYLFDVTHEGKIFDNAIYNLKEDGLKVDINRLIYEILSTVDHRIQELYNINLEDGENTEIFTNFLDSHLYLLNEDETLNKFENLSEQDKQEIKEIYEEFN
jgi:hypothetical protein